MRPQKGDSKLQKDQPVRVGERHTFSPNHVREIYGRSWAREPVNSWGRQSYDRPTNRCTLRSSQGAFPSFDKQIVRHDRLPMPYTQTTTIRQAYVQSTSDQLASFPSFADVASHGDRCMRKYSPDIFPQSSSQPNYAHCLFAALPAPPAALPPPIAPWALGPAGYFCDCAGACAVCSAACGGAAGFDDPFRADWPHW